MNDEEREERNRYLRQVVPGETLTLECSDEKTRRVEVGGRIEKDGGGVILTAKGHGTTYTVDVPAPDIKGALVTLQTANVQAWVKRAQGPADVEGLWSDTTAADLGIKEL